MKKLLLILLLLIGNFCFGFDQIEITGLKKYPTGYSEISCAMRFSPPAEFVKLNVPAAGIDLVISTYGFSVDKSDTTETVILYTAVFSFGKEIADIKSIEDKLVAQYNELNSKLNSIKLTPEDLIIGLKYDGMEWK